MPKQPLKQVKQAAQASVAAQPGLLGYFLNKYVNRKLQGANQVIKDRNKPKK